MEDNPTRRSGSQVRKFRDEATGVTFHHVDDILVSDDKGVRWVQVFADSEDGKNDPCLVPGCEKESTRAVIIYGHGYQTCEEHVDVIGFDDPALD